LAADPYKVPEIPVPDPYATDHLPPSPESKRSLCHESLGAAKGEAGHSKRRLVRIVSYRRRLLDPDNLVGGVKYFVDSIRYAQLIAGDAPENITLSVSQEKVKCRQREYTEIEILP